MDALCVPVAALPLRKHPCPLTLTEIVATTQVQAVRRASLLCQRRVNALKLFVDEVYVKLRSSSGSR